MVQGEVTRKVLASLRHPTLSESLTTFTNISQLKQTHAHLIVSGLLQNLFTTTRLLACAALSHFRDITYAKTIFQQIPNPSLFTYNTMFRAFSQCPPHQSIECITYYKHMLCNGLFPDNFTFPFVIRTCALLSNLFLGQQVHSHVVKNGLGCCDVFVVNTVMNMYSSFGQLSYAQKVFEECFRFVDVVSWTTLVTGYSNSGEIDKARWYFDRMLCKNIVSWNAMISGYVRFGRIDEARKLFDEMPERDVASWSAMISGYSQCGMSLEALGLFREMVKAMVVPNEPALVSAILACAQLRALEEGVWIHEFINENKFEINVMLGTSLLDMYGKCGSIERALRVFNSMLEKNVYSWNSMIAGLAFNGCERQALSLFWRMQFVGPTPNGITFIAVLSGCSHSGLVDEGRYIFSLMTQKYQIKPQLEHYGCMVDLLGRAGLIKEALEFVEGMPIEPHPGLWGALVSACRIHGHVELGKKLGKRLINLEPHHGGRYALLSNIFADAKQWDDMEMVRNLLKDRKVLKTPGNSVVES